MPVKRTAMTCRKAAYKAAFSALALPKAMFEGELVASVTKKAAVKKKAAAKKR
jgi:hypothetical protein